MDALPTLVKAPLPPTERLVALDFVRCLALFGVLVMNTTWFFNAWYFPGPEDQQFPGAANRAAMFATDVLFNGKANSLLSLLFGVGFWLQYQRLGGDGLIYARRVFVLAVLGAVHSLLFWTGDVLHVYALLGLLLPLVRRLSQRWLLALIVATWIKGPLTRLLQLFPFDAQTIARMEGLNPKMYAEMNAAFASSDVLRMTAARASDLVVFYGSYGIIFFSSMALTMLMGLYAVRAGWLTTRVSFARLWPWLALTLSVGVAAAIVVALIGPTLQPFEMTWRSALVSVAYNVQRPAIMIGYLILFLALGQRVDASRGLARALVRTGRMPLTTYLTQTAVMTTLSYGYGFGAWGKVGPAAALGLALFPLQVWFADRYLETHRFGPLERAWRFVSYGRAD